MIIILFLLFTVINSSKNIKSNLIVRFLQEYNSKYAIVLVCWTDRAKINLLKSTHLNTNTRTVLFSTENYEVLHLYVKPYDEINFILDLDCPNAFELLQKDSSYYKFRNIYNWLIITKNTGIENYMSYQLSSIKLRLDTRLKIAVLEEESSWKIFEIYRSGIGVDSVMKLIGYFVNGSFNYYDNNLNFYERRKNLKGVLIRTGSTYNFSFRTEEDIAKEWRNAGDRNFEKFNFQLFLCLMNIHKFKYNTTFRNAYFGNSTSGTDSGIAQLVHERKVDMSTSGGFPRVDRMDYYDFLVPIYKFRTCFIFVNPGKVKPGIEVLKPFSSNTWYVLLLTGLFIGAAFHFAYWVEYKFARNSERYSFFTSLVITISVLAQQGSAIVPFRATGRIIFLNLLIFSMMIYNYYTSSLVSSLLSSVPEAISTIKELYESKLKVAIEPRPYTITYFIQQQNDRYINLLNKTKIYEDGVPNYMTLKEGIAKVKEGTYAYHTDELAAYSWLQSADQEILCDLAEINFIPNCGIGLVMQKNSEYTELFQISLRKMQANGVYDREKKFWVPKKPECLLSTRVKAVGINELFLVYIILCFGFSTALFIFCLEIIYYKRTQHSLIDVKH